MSVITEFSIAIVLGGAFAAGLLAVGSLVPRWGALSLTHRIAPYVRDIADPRGLTPVVAVRGQMGWRRRWVRLLSRGSSALEHRLAQAGSSLSAVSFRARQLGWTIAGVLAGAALAIVSALATPGNPGAVLLAPLIGGASAIVYDVRLGRTAARRRSRIEDELPTVLEFLSLCLAAGEGLRDALRRIGHVGTGELTLELRRAVLDSGTGSSLAESLLSVARRLDVPALARAVDHIVAAIDRGAPLAQVLQDQAVDAREDAKRSLIEMAGRKEITMLLPLVFLLLPLSVLFAVFPGVVMLRLGVG
jgi:tight adherence protein C